MQYVMLYYVVLYYIISYHIILHVYGIISYTAYYYIIVILFARDLTHYAQTLAVRILREHL